MVHRDSEYLSICVSALVIALTASLLAIYLGIRTGVKNGHSLVVLFMNIMQIVYSIAVYLVDTSVLQFSYNQFTISETISMYAGVVSTLLSNVLAFAAVFIIYRRQTVPIVQYFHHIMFWCSFPGIIISIAYLAVSYPEEDMDEHAQVRRRPLAVGAGPVRLTRRLRPSLCFQQNQILLGAYYYLRIASIWLNFLFSGLTLYKIHSMSTKLNSKRSLYEVALRTLAKRMVLYPIVQALGRSGFAWYEGEYGNNVFSLQDVSSRQYAAMVFCVLVTPMMSVGYLGIFLFMQPEAMEHFKALVFCRTYVPPKLRVDNRRNHTGSIAEGKAADDLDDASVRPEDILASGHRSKHLAAKLPPHAQSQTSHSDIESSQSRNYPQFAGQQPSPYGHHGDGDETGYSSQRYLSSLRTIDSHDLEDFYDDGRASQLVEDTFDDDELYDIVSQAPPLSHLPAVMLQNPTAAVGGPKSSEAIELSPGQDATSNILHASHMTENPAACR